MSNCKFRRYGSAEIPHSNRLMIKTFTCDEVRDKIEDWKREFRERNATDHLTAAGMKDMAYERYCKEMDDFLSQCKCEETKEKLLPVCSKCPKEDHEGYFCRCEGRNIRLARQEREEGKSVWIK